MDIFNIILFVIPLIPLVHATIQDWRHKEIDALLIACVAIFGFTLKVMFFPDSLIGSLTFGLFALGIGIFIAEFKGWTIADGLMLGAIGLAVKPVDYYMFFFILLVSLAVLNIMFKLKWRKQKVEMDGIYTILITFVIYTLMVF